MIKILFVLIPVDGYGAEKSLLSNIIYLKNQKLIKPFVVINKNSLSLETLLIKENIKFYKIPFNCFVTNNAKGISALVKPYIKIVVNKILAFIFKIICKQQFDLVYTNTLTTYFGLFLSRNLKTKHVLHIREVIGEQFDFKLDFGVEKTYDKLKKGTLLFICNSEYTKNYYSNYFTKDCLIVLPNPVTSYEQHRNRVNNTGKIKLICLGRYFEDKNQIELLKAVKVLNDRGFNNFKLDLYGSGVLENQYKQFVSSNDLNSLVSINGYADNVSSLLGNYDIAVVPSRFEAFGRVTIEYILNGLTVIGNDSGNTKYLVEDEVSGLIYKYGNALDLSKKIELLVANEKLRDNLSKEAKRQIGNKFSVENSSRELYNALNKYT
ncbi:MAG: glycosyltransferase family 4 protein [Jejuia sp.]